MDFSENQRDSWEDFLLLSDYLCFPLRLTLNLHPQEETLAKHTTTLHNIWMTNPIVSYYWCDVDIAYMEAAASTRQLWKLDGWVPSQNGRLSWNPLSLPSRVYLMHCYNVHSRTSIFWDSRYQNVLNSQGKNLRVKLLIWSGKLLYGKAQSIATSYFHGGVFPCNEVESTSWEVEPYTVTCVTWTESNSSSF